MRCYLAEHAMSWERGVVISAAGTSHCHGIRVASHKGFMLSALGNPHIYISPCALLNYARLLDYYDALLAEDANAVKRLGDGSTDSDGSDRHGGDGAGRSDGSTQQAVVVLGRHRDGDQGGVGAYLWAIDRLRQQVIALGGKPLIDLPN
jgi:hypothetical protein